MKLTLSSKTRWSSREADSIFCTVVSAVGVWPVAGAGFIVLEIASTERTEPSGVSRRKDKRTDYEEVGCLD
jgi:hypothetical protein